MSKNKIFLSLAVLLILVACDSPPTQPRDQAFRQVLTAGQLFQGFRARSPVDEAALTPPPGANPARHTFEGHLELLGEDSGGDIEILRGRAEVTPHLPEFDFEFVQVEGFLVPIQRGLVLTDHKNWNYFLEPGRVWYEPGDGNYSRASFPFALSWKDSNAIHNGTMTFLFNDQEISKVWYQATQETAVEFRMDLWGLLEAAYRAEPVQDADRYRQEFLRELADRLPTRPLEALAQDYPGVDPAAFIQDITPEAITWVGFVVNGTNYLGGCQTRYGIYPYCESMRAPSYSTAKSLFASLALMRLAQKYDPMVSQLLVKDYVPEASASRGDWSQVTFDHVLDMATGNYASARRMADEEQWDSDPFWLENSYQGKITAAFDWPHNAPPGTVWVYRTSDTFIATRALGNYLQSQAGPQSDIFDFVVDEVYRLLNMGPGVFSSLRAGQPDGVGQPYGGYGLWWVPDDLAKLAIFLNVEAGRIGGEQVLHPDLLAAAMQQDPNDRGVKRDGDGRYNNAFWADIYDMGDGSDCNVWVPHMYGYSGILVALIPNGSAYYYASDNQEFSSIAAIRESHKIIPLCPE